MYNILTLNSISSKIYDVLDSNYAVSNDTQNPDAILVRSAQMAEYAIGDNLLAVGRAGAGVNNIPLDKMAEAGVCVFNTPGANANAVKELVIASMFLACRDIIGGISWANTLVDGETDVAKQVEKGKSKFAGIEIFGKTLGIFGLGAIGILVANAAAALGMKVLGYDPMISDANKAKLDPSVKLCDMEEVKKNSDFITLHLPLLPTTKNMIDDNFIADMRDGAVIINAARGELVDTAAVKAALEKGKLRSYVVDFPKADALNTKGIIAIPHLGASTEEAEENCAIMAAEEIKDYLENGNVKNSVNFPCISKARDGKRTTVVACICKLDELKAIAPTALIGTRNNTVYAIIDGDVDVDKLKTIAIKVRQF